jgi:hypothetical protein
MAPTRGGHIEVDAPQLHAAPCRYSVTHLQG